MTDEDIEALPCAGCRNIARLSFPFMRTDYGEGTKHGIDTEGCGEHDKVKGCLVIHFCPVCGTRLPPLEAIDA